MKNIVVDQIVQTPIEQQHIEIVERKGIGHPDSIADGIAEAISRSLSQEYLKNFEAVLHHNTDETQIVAGRSTADFGIGEMLDPIYILLVGRATKTFNDLTLPVNEIALHSAKTYLDNSLNSLNPDSDVIFDIKFGEGSTSLTDLYKRGVPMANDTSFGIGYAPFSETENMVKNVEHRIYDDFRNKNKAIGEDVKVMGLREGDRIILTIACAFVSRYVNDLDEYISIKEQLVDYVKDITSTSDRDVEVYLNTADDYDRGSVYLTVTGTSADSGDDGSVGRGNRCNGLITPGRPMSMEAASGKNPVNHVGKLYNLLSNLIADDCCTQVEGINEAYVRILSQIGKPIDDPRMLNIQVIPDEGADISVIESKAKEVAEYWLENASEIHKKLAKAQLCTF